MSIFIFVLITTAFVFLPFFANPGLLLNRNNDLTEFFWPIFYYLKENILINHQIPYWNNIFFSGTPLLPDPQNPIWYLPNIIFLFTSIDTAILVSLFIHSLVGSLGMYLLARRSFNFSSSTSILLAGIYSLLPLPFSYLEAGHWGLFIVWNWLPFLVLSSYKLTLKPNFAYLFLFAASASSIYFNHVLTSLITSIPILLFWIYKKSFLFPLLASLITLIIIFPAFYLQYGWQPETTRSLLLSQPETFPIWRGKRDFIKTLFIFSPETEKAITLGIIPSLIAIIGFLKIKRTQKIISVVIITLTALISMNNVSPWLPLLMSSNLFVLMRVTTRVWPVAVFMVIFLVGKGLETLRRRTRYILGILALVELIFIGYSYYQKPIVPREDIPAQIYEVLTKDKSNFRIFCLTRCIPQKNAAIYHLQLVEGYGTLQQKDYFYSLQKALNTRWNKYTLSVPPFEVYLFQKLQPNAKLLADFNTKYVISKYLLIDTNFVLLERFDQYYLYSNRFWKPI